MKKDIVNRKDIEKLVDAFYDKLKNDATLGHFFKEVVNVDWEKHAGVLYCFWENVLFYTGNYNGNPMQQHILIHAKKPFTIQDFTQWTLLFNETVDAFFEGKNAESIKQRAQSISTIMQIKLFK
ncbi:MAG: group III truncated hemoglobin [Bacteroidetes bacterium]|nr:group III truncated hemoglobin [Bacteroidota bacterium]